MTTPDPTPDEIRAALAHLQSGWSEHDRELHRYRATHYGQYRREEYKPPVVRIADVGLEDYSP